MPAVVVGTAVVAVLMPAVVVAMRTPAAVVAAGTVAVVADVRVPPALDWDDNEAGYSDWGQARNLNAQGVPEDKMKKLAASYKQQGVPIGAWEVDCNFQCKPTPRSPMGTSFVLFSRFFPTHGRPWTKAEDYAEVVRKQFHEPEFDLVGKLRARRMRWLGHTLRLAESSLLRWRVPCCLCFGVC